MAKKSTYDYSLAILILGGMLFGLSLSDVFRNISATLLMFVAVALLFIGNSQHQKNH